MQYYLSDDEQPTSLYLAEARYVPLSTWNWLATLLVLAIPVLGLLVYIYWAFASGTHPSRRNYCRAILILALVSLVLTVAQSALVLRILH